MRFRFLPAAIVLAVTASPAAFAQTPADTSTPSAPTGDTVRLTDSQRDAILNSNTVESAAIARGEQDPSENSGRGIHGEISAMIGSNGTRGVAGTAAIPLGNNGGAVVSFESSRFGYPTRR
ncbi:hypothetical protein [Sphingomonas immobilis]|uniref:Uncharacterized protein n=1 Tax=Sphingomonas immobilis TaxID=3063997 RepID=A0ABT9A4C9_9SPHN|nr:hypothetical protein [Sphingomonas sp. CA1-15]MDO7844398.1 hypothetical protein [Sphingomonas sp. CA1-15]